MRAASGMSPAAAKNASPRRGAEVHRLSGGEEARRSSVILRDTGPLVALIDRDDPHHRSCVAALELLPAEAFLTTWPCFTEAMYLLGRAGGLRAQEALWSYLADGLAVLHTPEAAEWQRMRVLMRQYGDAPMDLADASLVAAAERMGLRHIFTVDNHFGAYRIHGRQPFEVVP